MNQYAIICPSCKQLINKSSERCPNCGWNNNSFWRIASSFKLYNYTNLLIGANIAFYVFSLIISFFYISNDTFRLSYFTPDSTVLSIIGWASSAQVFGDSPWRLLSSVFLHGGFFHILFNMLWLFQIYPQNESLIGREKTLLIYILSGIAGSLAATLINSTPVVGASGAIFGLMGSFIAVGRESNNMMLRLFAKRYVTFVVVILLFGFLIPGVSNLSHIGGGLAGFILGKLFFRIKLGDATKQVLFLVCNIILLVTFGYMIWSVLSLLI